MSRRKKKEQDCLPALIFAHGTAIKPSVVLRLQKEHERNPVKKKRKEKSIQRDPAELSIKYADETWREVGKELNENQRMERRNYEERVKKDQSVGRCKVLDSRFKIQERSQKKGVR